MRSILLIAAVALLLSLGACQGAAQRPAGALSETPPAGLEATAAPVQPALQQDLAALAAYAAPAGVEPRLFAELKAALQRELLASAAGAPAKTASCLDPFDCTLVTTVAGDCLEWAYTNFGDYDFNGEVGVGDLVPLAVHYKESSPGGVGSGFPVGSVPGWVDGDRNGEVNIADIITIGQHFRESVTYYSVYRHPQGEPTPQWTEVGTVQLSSMVGDTANSWGFRYQLEPDHAGYEYRAVPRYVPTATPANEIGAPDVVPPAYAALSGRVTNVDGQPLQDVRVAVAQPYITAWPVTATDANGLFMVSGMDIGRSGATTEVVVTFNRPGYAEACQVLNLVAGRCVTRDLTMLRRTPVASVSALKGGSAVTAAGIELTLPPGGLVSANGTPLADSVGVNLTYIDPTAAAQIDAAPGNMMARQADYSTVRLASYGMAEVFLDDGSGEPANLGPDQTATLEFPIAAAQRDAAPENIGLYSFDTKTGKWIEEGKAQKNADGTAYVAEVGHFSYWNCDRPVAPTHIKVVVADELGNPLSDATVTSAGVTYAGSTYQNTGASGAVVFTVEQSAVERISVEYLGVPLSAPQEVATPAANFAPAEAPLVATFTVPAGGTSLTLHCQTETGYAIPGAQVTLREAGGKWQRQLTAGLDGSVRTWVFGGTELDVAASYNGAGAAPQHLAPSGSAQTVNLTLSGAHVPPIARFKIDTTTTPEVLAPLGLALDASATNGPAPIAFYHWTLYRGMSWNGEVVLETSASDALLEHVLTAPGHCVIKLEVTDQFGQSDTQYGSICVY